HATACADRGGSSQCEPRSRTCVSSVVRPCAHASVLCGAALWRHPRHRRCIASLAVPVRRDSIEPGEDVLRFPHGFLWGAATSAHQTEGYNRNSDWWRSEEAGLVPYRSGDACDSWNRWREDLQIVKDLGLNAY